jgi:hypothetical protein
MKKITRIKVDRWLSGNDKNNRHTIERIGKVSEVVVKQLARQVCYYGSVSPCKRKGFNKFITVTTPISKRSVGLNLINIVQIEDVVAWKETINHDNNSFKSPQIRYFYTGEDIDVITSGNHGHDGGVGGNKSTTSSQFNEISEEEI